MTDKPENDPKGRPETDKTKVANTQPPGKKVSTRRSSGKGLAALMFILGLLIGILLGGLAGLFTPRTGVLEGLPGAAETTPSPSPEPTTVTRTVEVETLRTPRDCLAALNDLGGQLDQLADTRQALMRADLARVSGDSTAADDGYADVDSQLRRLIIAGNSQSLQTAIDNCRAQGDPQDLPAEDSPAVPATPTPDETPEPEAEPTLPPVTPTPTAPEE